MPNSAGTQHVAGSRANPNPYTLLQAGAKHVYGIECSGIIHTARQIIADNGLSDKITLIHGKCEEIDLPVDTVFTRTPISCCLHELVGRGCES